MAKVSVLLPLYNAEKTIGRAIKSLQAQTFSDWEAILVDDGSTDSSGDIVRGFDESRIKLIRFPQNHGRPVARQKALDESTGEYICMLDADDFYLPTKLESQIKFLDRNPKVGLVSTNVSVVDETYELKGVIRYIAPANPYEVFPPMSVPGTLPIPHAPSMLRRRSVENVKYDLNLKQSEDFDFLLKVLLRSSYAILNEASYVYRFDLGMTKKKILERLNLHSRIFRKYLSQYPVAVAKQMALLQAKRLVYSLVGAVGKIDEFNSRQIRRPTSIEKADFAQAKSWS